jgi:hypothetical protein
MQQAPEVPFGAIGERIAGRNGGSHSLSRQFGEIFESAPPEETPEAVEAFIPVVVARDSENDTAPTIPCLSL